MDSMADLKASQSKLLGTAGVLGAAVAFGMFVIFGASGVSGVFGVFGVSPVFGTFAISGALGAENVTAGFVIPSPKKARISLASAKGLLTSGNFAKSGNNSGLGQSMIFPMRFSASISGLVPELGRI